MTSPAAIEEVHTAVLELLAARAEGATVCPSEVARALATARDGTDADWRSGMPRVHDAIDALLAIGQVRLSWKGEPMPGRSGPYRIHRID